MKRTGGFLNRYTELRRRVRVKARNVKRYAKNWARAYGSSDRAAWVRTLPCIVCAAEPSENAHIRGDGAGRKAAADTIVPLCFRHHTGGADSLHALQPAAFERYHNVNLAMYAAETDALYRRMGGV